MKKQLCTNKICFSSLDVSEIFVSGVFSMYNVNYYIMHHLNFFLPCSIRNLVLASLSRLFITKIDVFSLLQVLIPTMVFFHENNY